MRNVCKLLYSAYFTFTLLYYGHLTTVVVADDFVVFTARSDLVLGDAVLTSSELASPGCSSLGWQWWRWWSAATVL